MAGQSTMFIMEMEKQEVGENGERVEVSLFSEPATEPGDLHIFSPPNSFSLWVYHNLRFTDEETKPRETECLAPGHPASTR